MINPLLGTDYRPTFSGHETFPLRYGWLQKAFEAVDGAERGSDAVHVFRDATSIARFGVGRNMVGSLRYWASGAGILSSETEDGLAVDWLGELLFGKEGIDPYLEEDGSLWLLHWHLASRPRLTAFYWLFNEYAGGIFTRKDIVRPLLTLSEEAGWQRVADTTVDRDIQCLLRTYVGGRGESEAGDSILAELGLIRPLGQSRYSIPRGQKPSLPDCVFLYALWEFWDRNAADRSTLSYESVAFHGGSPGRVFSLDESALVERLEGIERSSQGAIAWSETAGLRQIVRHKSLEQQDLIEIIRADMHPAKSQVAA
ncbi:DUF4007 family protein [Hyphomonas oceanitis]|uniref:DUF4007 domain-containing protein n=1 Tax=Hyphomonas oceanitis SCH89 TaxID=1280953 RepID=A0A059G1G6_9PROT|nr:DUF4007 family protein [Hyphomonas oceanitis]KDA00712.1 hypothetical protein HOC_19161 [Hyphomonas oceanitis SCH89]